MRLFEQGQKGQQGGWVICCELPKVSSWEFSYSRFSGSMSQVVNSMKTLNNSNEINIVRAVFIETLSDEFTSKTGVGVYAYLAPMDINQLFKDYLHQNKTIRFFTKCCVKKHSFELS